MSIERVFLGWDRPPLVAAADWLHEQLGEDIGALRVATPGARAARRLRELLARRASPAWTPPVLLTAGTLTDELLDLARPTAGRLARTLAWERALRSLPAADLARLVARAPASDDRRAWLRLAAEVRELFGEVAAEGLDLAQVAGEAAARIPSTGERGRWEALARAQEQMVRLLEAEGLADPHLARRAALEAGRVRRDLHVVLVGVPELNGLTRNLLAEVERVTVLVAAPAEEAEGFDPLGCVLPEAWAPRRTSLDLEHWDVVGDPVQQARRAIERLAQLEPGRHAPEDLTVGVADESVVPYLERQLAGHGLEARDAAGKAAQDSSVVRLLAGLRDWLRQDVFRHLAALLRHPDLERVLTRDDLVTARAPAPRPDVSAADRAPPRLDGAWRGEASTRGSLDRREDLAALEQRLRTLLGELDGGLPRPLSAWGAPLRSFLTEVLRRPPIDPDAGREEWNRVESLRAVSDALTVLEDLPPSLVPEGAAHEALELLLTELGGTRLAPRPLHGGRGVVELLGWLELPLDDAPVLIVTGFDEGRVPEARSADGWLPDSLRGALHLPDVRSRLARDLYLVEVLVHSRHAVFVSGRRSAQGDPVLPSRIAFQCPEEELPARVRHALPEASALAGEGPAPAGRGGLPFLRGVGREPSTWSASAIAAYLQSPYLFWVQRCLRRETMQDGDRELGPLAFGNLAHAVLEEFGRSELRHSRDAEELRVFLSGILERMALERFGPGAEPAVRLQVEQMHLRLAHLAQHQARQAREGWVIQHVEWTPSDARLDLGGGEEARFSARIDRIDRHLDGRWRILDYKTGEKGSKPVPDHRKKDRWTSVQLPLYAHFARELVGDDPLEVGYVVLSSDERQSGFQMANWLAGDLAEGVEVARQVVREVRRKLREEEPFEHTGGVPYEPVLRNLVGVGLDDEEPAAAPGEAGGEA